MNDHEFHDEDTLRKVFDALEKITGSEIAADDCIHEMQNAGILFRERKQADREPSDAEVTDEMARAALNAFYPDYATKAPNGWTFVNIWAMKAALLAAQEVRRG